MNFNNKKTLLRSLFLLSTFTFTAYGHAGFSEISETGISLPSKNIANFGDIKIMQGGFGSSAFKDSKHDNRFYALTDRGPNADGKNKNEKQFLVPNFQPTIGHYEVTDDGKIILLQEIRLTNPKSYPISGLPNPKNYGATGEKAINCRN